jgi:hypothetical protein
LEDGPKPCQSEFSLGTKIIISYQSNLTLLPL